MYPLPGGVWQLPLRYLISLNMLIVFFWGRTYLEEGRKKKRLRIFALLVLFCLITQFIMDLLKVANNLDVLAGLIQGRIIGKYDRLTKTEQDTVLFYFVISGIVQYGSQVLLIILTLILANRASDKSQTISSSTANHLATARPIRWSY